MVEPAAGQPLRVVQVQEPVSQQQVPAQVQMRAQAY